MTKEAIKKLLAKNHLDEAINQLMTLFEDYLVVNQDDQAASDIQTILILNSRKYADLQDDKLNGILERKDEQITLNEILNSLLSAIKEMPEGVWQTEKLPKILENPDFNQAISKSNSSLDDFVFIKGGTFMMGTPDGEPNSEKDEKPQHRVQVSNFYMSKYPVTLDQFRTFILDTDYETDAEKGGGSFVWTGKEWEKWEYVNWEFDVNGEFQMDDNQPVIHVSWNDAKAYCNWLSKKLNLLVRLPREAEWEYACRAGSASSFSTGDNLSPKQANYNGHEHSQQYTGMFLERTSYVGAYPANAWGLFDMHGNVLEWCEDWYSETYYSECQQKGLSIDPEGPTIGSFLVVRGGSWLDKVHCCRSAFRYYLTQGNRGSRVGFRPAISL